MNVKKSLLFVRSGSDVLEEKAIDILDEGEKDSECR